jgi:hypothetical protein
MRLTFGATAQITHSALRVFSSALLVAQRDAGMVAWTF